MDTLELTAGRADRCGTDVGQTSRYGDCDLAAVRWDRMEDRPVWQRLCFPRSERQVLSRALRAHDGQRKSASLRQWKRPAGDGGRTLQPRARACVELGFDDGKQGVGVSAP